MLCKQCKGMTHKLAGELKEAGFPMGVHYPHLSEVIDEIGENFRWLKKKGHGSQTKWLAQGRPHPTGEKEPKEYGETGLQAVSQLYLVLKK